MRVLLTNDDGIEAEGLQVLRRHLAAIPGIDLQTIAPDGNRSAIGRGITTRRPLMVGEVTFGDGTVGYATDGTPVDCVRLAQLGLVEGWVPELVVAGINHGANLGDDITYSGTVAAALEGVLLGLPAIAISQQSAAREMDFRLGDRFEFEEGARFCARLVEELDHIPLPGGTLLNVNVPAGDAAGVVAARLGKRIYRDELKAAGEGPEGKRTYWIYGDDPGYQEIEGTDLAAVAAGYVAVTPLHLDLTYEAGLQDLSEHDFQRLLAPAAREVE
jgi:5'-nucleotidase